MTDKTQKHEEREALEPEELDEQEAEALPDREEMTMVRVPWEPPGAGITLPDPLPPATE